MNENKGQTIFLSVIGIATLLVAIIGATFAFFTTQITGNDANVTVKSAKIGAVTFTAQSVDSNNTAILPGWTSGAKTVEVQYGASDYPVDYTCRLNVTENDFTDMTLAVSGTNAVAAANKKLTAQDTSVLIAEGTLEASSSTVTKTMTYTLTFPETYVEQNGQQDADFAASVTCALSGGTVYYNTTNPNGTATPPQNNA